MSSAAAVLATVLLLISCALFVFSRTPFHDPSPGFIIQDSVPVLDAIFTEFAAALPPDARVSYGNHCYRVYNLCMNIWRQAIGPERAKADEELVAIAVAFHDIGLWTHDTVDYLPPSKQVAKAWVEKNRPHFDTKQLELVLDMIEEHHKVTEFVAGGLVNAFRMADWIDVMRGAITFGGKINRSDLFVLQTRFPNAGFHATLVRFGFKQLLRDPLNPLPMFKL